MTKKASFSKEKPHWHKGYKVFGIDEVGRGSFAGPLVGAAVSFDPKIRTKWIKDICDSKLLTHKQRVRLSNLIKKHSNYFIESIEINTINKIGIGKSNALLFKNLISKISKIHTNCYFIVDGRKIINLKSTDFIIKGDNVSRSIAAASIVAKVYRDELMRNLSKKYNGYYLYKNKGYGTKLHISALKKLGASEIHRKSFNLSKFLEL